MLDVEDGVRVESEGLPALLIFWNLYAGLDIEHII